MFNQTQWTNGSRTGLAYFTAGLLIDVWVTVWYFAYARSPDHGLNNNTWFWLAGLFLTGLTLILIGIMQGAIHRSAQNAETKLAEKTAADAAKAQANAAIGVPQMIVPSQSVVAPPMQPVNQVPPAVQAPTVQRI